MLLLRSEGSEESSGRANATCGGQRTAVPQRGSGANAASNGAEWRARAAAGSGLRQVPTNEWRPGNQSGAGRPLTTSALDTLARTSRSARLVRTD